MNPVTLDSIKNILVEQIGANPDDVGPTSNLVADLGCDSLDIVEIVMACDEEFEIDIAEETADNIETVADLIAVIEKEQNK